MNDGLKQRLIGALVLVGIAVIFLPGFFKEHTPYEVDTRSQIPLQPDVEPVVVERPQPPQDAEPAPDPQTMFLPEASSSAASEPTAGEASEAVVSSSASSVAPASRASTSASSQSSASAPVAEPDAWVVQVASLSRAESAQALRQKLQERGYKAYVRLAQTSQGEVSRVFIGPKLDKQAALAIKESVDPAFKVDSLVLRFKP